MKRDILLKEGACYKHKKEPIYKKIINLEKQECIHFCIQRNHLVYVNPALIYNLEEFVPIDEEEFNQKMNEFIKRVQQQ